MMNNEDKKKTAGEALAANVVRFREARGWTTQDLADAAGIPIDQMTAFERAEQSPTLSDMRQFAIALGIPLSALFENV